MASFSGTGPLEARHSVISLGREPQISASLYHRDSLALPTAITQLPREQARKHAVLTKKPPNENPRLDGTRIQPRAPVPYPMIPGVDPEETFPEFMAGFCVEPRGDTETCCQAVWCPCVLYGKTDWRIKRFSRGEDGTDKSWRAKDGCNAHCWSFAGIKLVFPICT